MVKATDVVSCGDLSVALPVRVVSKPNLISDEVMSPRVNTGSERKEVSFLACACKFSQELVDESICVVVSSCSCSSERCVGILRENTDGSVDVSTVAVVPVWIHGGVEFVEVILDVDERIEVLGDCAEDGPVTKDCLVVEACAAIESGELVRGKSAIKDNGDDVDVEQVASSSPGLFCESPRGFEPGSTDIKCERSDH